MSERINNLILKNLTVIFEIRSDVLILDFSSFLNEREILHKDPQFNLVSGFDKPRDDGILALKNHHTKHSTY